jgi:hypothetical protein
MYREKSTGCWHPSPPLSAVQGGRYHLNEYNAILLTTGIGDGYNQTMSKLGQAALSADVKSPYEQKRWTNSVDPLYISLPIKLIVFLQQVSLFLSVFVSLSANACSAQHRQ